MKFFICVFLVSGIFCEGFDNFEDVRKHIVKYHQNVLLQLRKDLNEDEEREIDDFIKEFDEDGKRIISQ